MTDKTARLRQQAMEAHRRGLLDEAERTYRTLLKQNPKDAALLHMLGLLHAQRGDMAKAQELLARALAVRPDFAASHCTLGDIKTQLGDIAAGEGHYRQALKIQPQLAEAQSGLAVLLLRSGRAGEAVALYQRLAAAAPRNIETQIRLGQALQATGDAAAWLTAARNAAGINAGDPTLARALGEAEFASGNPNAGWAAYAHAGTLGAAAFGAGLAAWKGQDLGGSGLFIWTHGGPSEEIACARLLDRAIAANLKCLVRCSPRIVALLRRSFPGIAFIDRAPTPAELSGFVAQTPVAALGALLPAGGGATPYLHAEAARRAELRNRYADGALPKLRVGIAWQSLGALDGRERSVGLREWSPVLSVPGVTFVNLQHGNVSAAIQAVSEALATAITQDPDINPLGDLDSYAAQIAALDCVVTSSNTVAHLAGALGVQTLCLAPKRGTPGDRAFLFAEDECSSAYPSMRVLRKSEDGSWFPALIDATLAVADAAQGKGSLPDTPAFLRSLTAIIRRLTHDPARFAEAIRVIARAFKRRGDVEREHSRYLPARENYERAVTFYDEAIAADPGNWSALNAKGVLIANLGRPTEALDIYAATLALVPDQGEVLNNLGLALRASGRSAEALAQYERALKTVPETGTDTVNLNAAAVLDDLGRTDESVARLDALLARRPDHADTHYNKAITLLSAGRFHEGWIEFDWRLKRPAANVRHDLFPVKRWQGEELRGKRVLVWTEQGLGDEIMAASMLPELVSIAGSVALLCSPRMVPLLRRSFPTATVGSLADPLPRSVTDGSTDLQMSIADLGQRFRPTLDSFPAQNTFLIPDTARRDALRTTYLNARPGTRLVGLSWGSGNPEIGTLKSLQLRDLAPVLRVPGVTFVNLQYGDHASDLREVRRTLGVDVLHDPSIDPLQDMDAFAAQVAAMDLVVSVSNTTVHTAGGLGVPTWVLLAEGRGRIWYWFRSESRCAWYPSAQFLRQTAAADWSPVIGKAAERLAGWATGQPA